MRNIDKCWKACIDLITYLIFISDKNSENINILTEATVFKKESRRSLLTADGRTLTFDDLGMTLMAELLEYQNSEAQRIIIMLLRQVIMP